MIHSFTSDIRNQLMAFGSLTGRVLLGPAGSPVPEVSWFRDGQVLSAAALPGVQISFSDGRAVLRIPAVTAAHSGRFSVRATNATGQATSTAELLVTGESRWTERSDALITDSFSCVSISWCLSEDRRWLLTSVTNVSCSGDGAAQLPSETSELHSETGQPGEAGR